MAEIDNPLVYWPRWITARRLADERRRDPALVERMERLAAFTGFNLQLDEAAKERREDNMSKSDLDRAIKLASEWVAWFEANGEADEPEQPHEADWARTIAAMATVCDAVRLELGTLPSRHRRERLGDPRLHRIFDALEAIDGTATSAGLETEPPDAGAGACSEVVTGAASTFSLESARAMLANLERLPPDVSADDARCDLWVELREACAEVERLRADNGRLDHELVALRGEAREGCEALKEIAVAIDRYLPETSDAEAHGCDWLARIANAGAVIADARASRDAYQQEARAAERRLTDERSARIEVVQRLERAGATLKRWQARARKAEARVAVLTEERDGLTLRLGAKVAKQVSRRPSVTVRRGRERNVAVRMTGGGGGGGTGQRAKPARVRNGGRP